MDADQEYFRRLAEGGHTPNFWTSSHYWYLARWQARGVAGMVHVVDSEGRPMLPALDPWGSIRDDIPYWAGLPGYGGPDMLDYQFMYRPVLLSNLNGGAFRTVRKAFSTVSRDLEGEALELSAPGPEDAAGIEDLLLGWAGDRDDLYDPEIMAEYLFRAPGRAVIRSSRGLLGVLAWDWNWYCVNFRYCVVAPGIAGLSTAARALFWDYIARTTPGCHWINDGGALGRAELFHFKKTLNPTNVHTIFTKEKK